MEKELEALRTEYKFKVTLLICRLFQYSSRHQEQEIVASIRKPPASVRGKKAHRDFPATPLPPPRAGRSSGLDLFEVSRKTPDETPLRFRPTPPIFKLSPTKNVRKSPEKKVHLPGFENAFENCTPMRSPSKRENRKEKAVPMFDADSNDNPFAVSNSSAPETFMQPSPVEDAVVQETSTHNVHATRDEEVDLVPPDTNENDPEAEQVDWINWKAEVQYWISLHLVQR